MALTIANVHPQVPIMAVGQVRAKLVQVTFDSTYPAGGESLTAADLGLSQILYVGPSPDAAAVPGHTVQYNYSTSKLQVFVEEAVAAGGPLVENAVADISTLVVRLFVLGF